MDASFSAALIVVAAGSGVRMGARQPKAFLPVAGVSLLEHALSRALGCRDIAVVVVVAPSSCVADAEKITSACVQSAAHSVVSRVVSGGETRSASVSAGLEALKSLPPQNEGSAQYVLVHDAARAFAPSALFSEVARALQASSDAVVPVMPVVDTVKKIDATGRVLETVDRDSLGVVQTPQGFRREVLEKVHASGGEATDDAALVESGGGIVRCVPGSQEAFKITTPLDLVLAEHCATRAVDLSAL